MLKIPRQRIKDVLAKLCNNLIATLDISHSKHHDSIADSSSPGYTTHHSKTEDKRGGVCGGGGEGEVSVLTGTGTSNLSTLCPIP